MEDSQKSPRFSGKGKKRVLVIIPCRGNDIELSKNLLSIKSQSCKNFDSICVVDSLHDPAIKSIKEAGMPYMLSNSRIGKGSGKVKAIATAIDFYSNYYAYVIADSDMRVNCQRHAQHTLERKGILSKITLPNFCSFIILAFFMLLASHSRREER
ncbi:MAG: hypothetical protein ACP5NE_03440 [Candidatus Micrarchaeia archaeon]